MPHNLPGSFEAPGVFHFGFRISDLPSPINILLPEIPVGVALLRMLTGRAVSDNFGRTDDCCEWMTRAQTSSEGALTGNAA